VSRTVATREAGDVPKAPPDLRLGSAALGAWAGALLGGLLAPAVCWPIAGCWLAVAVWARRTAVIATGLVLLAAGLFVASLDRASLARGPVADLARKESAAQVELTVSGDPQALPPVAHLPPEIELKARLRVLESDGRRWKADLPVLVLAPASSWRTLLPSTRVSAAVALHLAEGNDVAAVLVAHRAPVMIRGPSLSQRWAGRIRTGLQRAAARLPRSERGLLPGLVVGDTSQMPAADTADFRRAGLTHLTAVSGANLAVVVAAVFWLLRWTPLSVRMRALVTAAALVGFAVLARPTPSVLRAACMGLLALAAIGLGRPRALLPALFGTLTGLVLFEPTLAQSPGFALSVLATLALLVLAPGWTAALRERLPSRLAPLAPAIATPLAAQVACLPVIAAISGTVSLAAVPANLLALPAVPFTTVLGLLASIVSLVSPGIAGVLCTIAGVGCHWLIFVTRTAARLPLATVTAPSGPLGLAVVTLVTAALVAAVRSRSGRRTLLFTALILAAARLAGRR
jgi:competence protein ComEC